MKELLNELKEDLLGKEMDVWELDNSMMRFNFASSENADMEEAKEHGNLAFAHKELEDGNSPQWFSVDFEVLNTKLTNDTDTDNFDLKVINIETL